MEKNKLKKLIVKNSIIGTVILALAIIALTIGLRFNEESIQQINLGKTNTNKTSEILDTYSVYMLLDQVNIEDDTNLSGNKVKISTNEEDLDISFFNVLTNESIQKEDNGNIEVPQEGIKLRIDGIKLENTYEINVESAETITGNSSMLKRLTIAIEANAEGEIVAFIKNITKVVDGQEVTTNGSEEKTAVFMYEDENNKIKIKGNKDVEIYYVISDIHGLSAEVLKTVEWQKYNEETGIEVEKNGKIYAKSKYKNGSYSEINVININNIDKINPIVTVEGTRVNETKDEAFVTVNMQDGDETEEYGKSGIHGYAITITEDIPLDYVVCENKENHVEELGGITENGTYYVWLSDKAGNITHTTFEITEIQEKEPEIVAIILDAPVAELKGTEYTSLTKLQEALDEKGITSSTGKVIVQMVNDVTNEATTISDKDLLIDLNGYTINSKLQASTLKITSGDVKIVDKKYNIAEYITDEATQEDLKSKYASQEGNGKVNSTSYIAIEVLDGASVTLGENDKMGALPNIEAPIIEGKSKGILNKGTFNFYGGVIIGKVPVEGNITDTLALYDVTTIQIEEKYKTIIQKVSGIEALIGKTRYSKLEDAIEAANNTKGTSEEQIEIDIVVDIAKNDIINIDSTKNILLDLNGYSISNTIINYIIQNNGKLEIIDSTYNENSNYIESGKIKSTTYGGIIYNSNIGELKISGGLLESSVLTNNIGIIQNDGTFSMNGGNIQGIKYGIVNTGRTTIKDGNIDITAISSSTSGGVYGILNQGTGSVLAEGGTITVTNNFSSYGSKNSSYGIWNNTEKGNIVFAQGNINAGTNGIWNQGTATITGGHIITEGVGIYNGSTLQVKDVIIEAGTGIQNANNAIIEGGDITAKNIGIGVGGNKETLITDITISARRYGINSTTTGIITIKGGNITGDNNGIYQTDGTIIIEGGNITGQTAINSYSSNRKNNIIIGKKDGEVDINTPNIKGNKNIGIVQQINTSNANSEVIFKYYDGTITGKLEAIQGSVSDTEEGYEIITTNTEEGEVVTLGTQEGVAYIGEDTNNLYNNLQSAVDAVEEETITLLKDISLVNSLNIPSSKKITINLNGKKIQTFNKEKTIQNEGELTITDNTEKAEGKITGYTVIKIDNAENGKLLISKGTIENKQHKGKCINNNGILTVDGGTITSSGQYSYAIYNNGLEKLILSGGTITSRGVESYAIYNANDGEVTLSGGTIDSSTIGIENISSGNIIVNGGNIKNSSSSSVAIRNQGNGEIRIIDGNINGSGKGIYNRGKTTLLGGSIAVSSNSIQNYGTLTVDGGEITNSRTGIYNNGEVTITNVNISAKSSAIQNNENTVTIKGGNITGNSTGIYQINGTVVVEGGNITGNNYGVNNTGKGTIVIGKKDGEVNTESPNIKGTYSYGIINSSGTIKFYDGRIEGKEGQSIQGAISETEEDYNIVKYKNGENENYNIENGYEISILEKLDVVHLKSTDKGYSSLEKAIIESAETDTITILSEISINTIQIDENKNIVIDLNGNNINIGNDEKIINNGNLEITNTKEEGKIIGNTANILNNENATLNVKASLELKISGKCIENKGNLIIEEGANITTNAGSSYLIYNIGEGNVIQREGNITTKGRRTHGIYNAESGNITIEGGSITTQSNDSDGIYNYGAGNVNVTGGNITATYTGSSGIRNNSSGVITIEGGEITGYTGIMNQGNGEVTIINGTITGRYYRNANS